MESQTVKEFLYSNLLYKNKINQFKDFHYYTLQNFINLELTNRPCKELQDECRRYLYKQDVELQKETIVSISEEYRTTKIGDIPYSYEFLEKIAPHSSQIRKILDQCTSLNFLIDLLDITPNNIIGINGLGETKIGYFIALQNYIKNEENWDFIVDIYDCCFKKHSFPENLSEEQITLSLTDKIDLAIKQYIGFVERIAQYVPKAKTDFQRMSLLFLERLSIREVAETLDLTRQACYELKKRFLSEMYGGNAKYASHLSFSDELKEEMDEFINTLPLFCSQTKLCELFSYENYDNSVASMLLPIKRTPEKDSNVGYNKYTNFDQVYYITQELDKTYLQKYVDSLYKIFEGDENAEIRPMSLDEIMESLYNLDSEFSFERNSVQALLEQHNWYEQVGDDESIKYQLKYKYLKKDFCKIARLVYEFGEIDLSQIDDLHRKKMCDHSAKSISNSKNQAKSRFPWIVNNGQNNIVIYDAQGEVKQQLKDVISQYAHKNKLFKFNELLEYLKNNGYNCSKEGTIRAYVNRCCSRSNEDRTLFCHGDFLEEYSNYTWRRKTQQGVLNWVLNTVRESLLDANNNAKRVKDLTSLIKDQAKTTPEKYKINSPLFLISKFIGKDNLFETYNDGDDTYIKLTNKGLETSDTQWSCIGVRNKKPPYYGIVVSKIISLLKDAPECEMLLSELKNACKSAMTEVSENQFYKIVDNELPRQIEKISKEDGKKYLQFRKEEVVYEPTIEIEQQTESESILIYKTHHEYTKQERPYGQILYMDWDMLLRNLKHELNFYARFWDLENISMHDGIELFVTYVKNLDNSRISQQIPRKLLILWNYQSDIYDRKELLNELVICYEELLRKIHISNTGVTIQAKGLYETYSNIPYINSWTVTENPDNNTYRRYFRYINTLRNKIAHGNDINFSSIELMQRIAEYTSLYVYTVARFLSKGH